MVKFCHASIRDFWVDNVEISTFLVQVLQDPAIHWFLDTLSPGVTTHNTVRILCQGVSDLEVLDALLNFNRERIH